MQSKITIGITGGIGSGKSTICRVFSTMGYPVFYSDTEAKEIMLSDSSVKNQIIKLFGERAYNDNGVNREYLAEKVFNNSELLSQINNIVHPAVRKKFNSWKLEQNERIVLNEAAILFETGAYKNFDHTILVTCPEELRISRIITRDKTSKQKVKERMNKQWSDEAKAALADFVICNDENSLVSKQVLDILKQLK